MLCQNSEDELGVTGPLCLVLSQLPLLYQRWTGLAWSIETPSAGELS